MISYNCLVQLYKDSVWQPLVPHHQVANKKKRLLQFLFLFIFLWIQQRVFQRMNESVFSTNTSMKAETGKYSLSPLKTIKRECFWILKILFQKSTFDILSFASQAVLSHPPMRRLSKTSTYSPSGDINITIVTTATTTSSLSPAPTSISPSSPALASTSTSSPAPTSTSPSSPALASSLLSGTWWTL